MGELSTQPDALVVALVLGGDTSAYGVLLQRYRDAYTRFAVRMLGSREDADDALQSAFIRAFRNLHQCQDPSRFGAWLYQIVMNECRTLGSRRGRRELRMVRDDAVLERALGPAPSDDSAWREEIQRALDELDVDQREAFVMKHVEEMGYEEMAEITGLGVSALKMRVKRACDRLRILLEEAYHEQSN
jgi:RNA polymerase sigma-70 factor (ECF subfamily)